MRFMGVDFGSKKVGIALSDDRGEMAFPKAVLPNDDQLLTALAQMVQSEGVGAIVMGESKNYAGEENPLMASARVFAERLSQAVGQTVHFEPEVLTTKEAERLQGPSHLTDASAAAIILQSYIDRLQNGPR